MFTSIFSLNHCIREKKGVKISLLYYKNFCRPVKKVQFTCFYNKLNCVETHLFPPLMKFSLYIWNIHDPLKSPINSTSFFFWLEFRNLSPTFFLTNKLCEEKINFLRNYRQWERGFLHPHPSSINIQSERQRKINE